ncbi:MAG: catalase [Spirochaetales bacterium]|nr:catalase [Spirochaetales bacterium]
MIQPATDWQEITGPDETSRHERYAKLITIIQKRKSKEYGTGRALHRKQILGLEGTFSVHDNLPVHAAQGLFARPASYACLIRYSNGGLDRKADSVPDIRGLALKILGLDHPGALGGQTNSQDFLTINQEVFSAKDSKEFMGVVEASVKGHLDVLKYMIRTHGLWTGLLRMKTAIGMLTRTFRGFASETFNTVLPFACGPYAARLRILPARKESFPDAKKDWAADLKKHLGQGPLVHEVQLQFFVSEEATPIEDGSRPWQEKLSPWITVGTLTIPQQPLEGQTALEREARMDQTIFDPWNALSEHRPLGEIMRARKVAYFASQKARGAR